MANPSNLNETIQRILNGTQTDSEIEALRQWLNSGGSQNLQVGKYNVNIGQGQDIHIGYRTYEGLDAEAIREVARSVLQGSNAVDIRACVRSILKEEFPNLAQPGNPQSSSRKTILVLASSPTNQGRLRLDKEVREIDEGLLRAQQREKFTLQQRSCVRPDDLRRALLDFNPRKYRLPTEAEWEYAAKALIGTQYMDENQINQRIYPWDGSSVRNPKKGRKQGQMLANFKRGRGDYAGIAGRSNDGAIITAEIYAYPANDFGLYNMAGNVNEWVYDVYRPLSYQDVNDLNPIRRNGYLDDAKNYDTKNKQSLIDDKLRVYKGGSWNDVAYWLSPGTRRFLDQD